MKLCLLTIFLLMFALFIPINAYPEIVQLIEVNSVEKADDFNEYSENDLLEIQKIKNQIITFVKSPKKSQLSILSPKYKGIFKNTEQELSAVFNKEAYSKIDFRKIEYFDKGKATIKANLYWELEGYDGLQTFYFMLVKENKKWLVDWMVY